MIYLSCLNWDFDAVNSKNVQFDDYIQTSYTNGVQLLLHLVGGET